MCIRDRLVTLGPYSVLKNEERTVKEKKEREEDAGERERERAGETEEENEA